MQIKGLGNLLEASGSLPDKNVSVDKSVGAGEVGLGRGAWRYSLHTLRRNKMMDLEADTLDSTHFNQLVEIPMWPIPLFLCLFCWLQNANNNSTTLYGGYDYEMNYKHP
jgi:hypothetical protein